jgi:hypothetical protein
MNSVSETRQDNNRRIAALHDQARVRAEQLRREAIDDFWRGGNAVVGGALAAAQRSAQRWAARLQRHKALRAAPRMG